MTKKDENKNRIYEIREYFRDDGVQISAKTPVDGSTVEYVGHATGQIKNPSGQVGNIPYTFAIEADSIEDAFVQFHEAGQKEWPNVFEKVKTQMQKQNKRIQVAQSVDRMLMQQPGGNGGGRLKLAK